MTPGTDQLRRAVTWAMGLNFAYFFVEFGVATAIGSVSLFADSIDFLEDTSINLLILLALGWGAKSRSRVGMALAVVLLVPGIATLWTVGEKIAAPVPPDPVLQSIAGTGAMLVNGTCAFILARVRTHGGSLSRAAFLSARNDVLANVAIVAAGFATFVTVSPWPDVVVGIGIFLMNLDAAREVFEAARAERRESEP